MWLGNWVVMALKEANCNGLSPDHLRFSHCRHFHCRHFCYSLCFRRRLRHCRYYRSLKSLHYLFYSHLQRPLHFRLFSSFGNPANHCVDSILLGLAPSSRCSSSAKPGDLPLLSATMLDEQSIQMLQMLGPDGNRLNGLSHDQRLKARSSSREEGFTSQSWEEQM